MKTLKKESCTYVLSNMSELRTLQKNSDAITLSVIIKIPDSRGGCGRVLTLCQSFGDVENQKRVIPMGDIHPVYDRPFEIDFHTLAGVTKRHTSINIFSSVMWAFRSDCGIDTIKRAACRIVWEQTERFIRNRESLRKVKVFKKILKDEIVGFVVIFEEVEIVDWKQNPVINANWQCVAPENSKNGLSLPSFVEPLSCPTFCEIQRKFLAA